MRIDSLRIVNFRSYADTKFSLNHQTYIVGHNNAGKTTLIDAIGWALTGKCAGLDGNNREIAELVREGQDQGLGAALEIADFGKIQRQTNGREVFLKVKDWTGTNAAQQKEMLEKLRTTEAVIAACLDTQAFLRLHHADAKNLVMGVLDVKIPAEDLEPLEIAGPLSLDELERHYKRAFDNRTAAKRDLDAHTLYPKPELLEGEEPPPLEDTDEGPGLLTQLAELREEERKLIGSSSEARGRLEEMRRQLAELRTERDAVSKRIDTYGSPNDDLDDVEEELTALDNAAAHARAAKLPDPPVPAEPAADPEAEAEEREIGELRQKLVDDRGRLKLIADSIGAIEAHDPEKGCVIDGSIPCKTPAKEFKGKLAAVRKEIAALEKAIGGSDARLSLVEASARGRADEVAARRREYDQAREAHTKGIQDRLAAERAESEARRALERRRSSAKARADHLQQDSDRLAEIVASVSRLQTEIDNMGDVAAPAGADKLRTRIERGEQLVERVRAWHQDNDRHLESLTKHEQLQKKVDRFELLCDKLGPKGLIVDALERARLAFEAKVNEALGRWGYRLEFTIDPWTVRVNGRKSTQLSKSQRLRVGVALQLAIAEIAGLWFVALDEVDMLDSDNRAILQDVIGDWRGQIVIGMTKDSDFEIPDDLPEHVTFYKLELRDEVTQVLGSATAAA